MADDDDYRLCRNVCNSTFTVRVCSAPGVVCVGWSPTQVVSLLMFLCMSVLGVGCGLASRSVGCVKLCQWTSGVVGLICFAIVISYTTAKSEARYDAHMALQAAIGATFMVGWLIWGGRLVWVQRRRAALARVRSYRAVDG